MRVLLFAFGLGVALSSGAAFAAGPNSGCTSCGPQGATYGNCNDGACKPSWFDKFKKQDDGCGSCSPSWLDRAKCGKEFDGCQSGCTIHDILYWYKKPCGNPAPTWRITGYPIGFPSHPYVRSPRDYFMVD